MKEKNEDKRGLKLCFPFYSPDECLRTWILKECSLWMEIITLTELPAMGSVGW